MSDIVQLLPDSIANQIAAGEVIQRPASVVKELLENSIDSGAKNIQLIIKDAGRTLIRVIDNGSGMSSTDARLSFERHATSKIRNAKDLFSIQTKGFRGEALASIAAIAHVELKTKLFDDEVGTLIEIEGSTVKTQEPCSSPNGSSFSVKNLFYNVPARRQFLKSDGVETRHIIDEFQRVALTHPDIEFTLAHNDNLVFQLKPGTHRQRIVSILGDKYNQRLVPVEENTNILNVFGFIGKPEFARKTRGEQFLFVNNRFIKSQYLNHAIVSAFHDLLPKNLHPLYLLYLEIDPAEIDINIHPTKTEIKFRDERSIYAIIHSTIKKSLGMFNVSPSLDFNQETSINISPIAKAGPVREPQIRVNPDFNPFKTSEEKASGGLASRYHEKANTDNWQELYHVSKDVSFEQESLDLQERDEDLSHDKSKDSDKPVFQIHNSYIVTQIKSGMMLIDQQRAHERILFEQNVDALNSGKVETQQLLFPITMEVQESEMSILLEIKDTISAMGMEIEEFGKQTIKINTIPAYAKDENAEKMMEELLDQLKNSKDKLEMKASERLALHMARSTGVKKGESLNNAQCRYFIDQLFACEIPNYTVKGKAIIQTMTLEEITQKFK